MKIRKTISALAVSALLALGGNALAGDNIKIGSFLAVTGPASFLGDPELKTLQMYVEEINAKGGVNGKQLELVHYDTSGKAKEAVNFAKRLIKKDKVDLIVGGSTSGSTLAVIPIVEKNKVPFISLAGSVKIIDPVKKWVFKMPHTDRMAAAKIFGDMKKRGITKVALISGDGGFDKSGRAQSLALAPEYGIEIVADESYSNKDTDMSTQLTKIRATDAQAILNFGFGTGPAIVTKNVRQLGIELPLSTSPTAWPPRSTSIWLVRRPRACACRPRPCWWRTSWPTTIPRSRCCWPTSPNSRRLTVRYPPSAATPMMA
jgi:branched-chain amino acid transport system substrate-binding protein